METATPPAGSIFSTWSGRRTPVPEVRARLDPTRAELFNLDAPVPELGTLGMTRSRGAHAGSRRWAQGRGGAGDGDADGSGANSTAVPSIQWSASRRTL